MNVFLHNLHFNNCFSFFSKLKCEIEFLCFIKASKSIRWKQQRRLQNGLLFPSLQSGINNVVVDVVVIFSEN